VVRSEFLLNFPRVDDNARV